MTFFNKKTEVMKVELTPHGRYLLSIGKLKPHRYRFFDEGVIYDSTGSIRNDGTEEHQSDIDNRIVYETPLLKGNPNRTGVATSYNNYQAVDVLVKEVRTNVKDDTINTLTRPLGTVRSDKINTVAFKVKAYDSQIISNQKFYNYADALDLNIPQIHVKVQYSASIVNTIIENQIDTTIDYQSDAFLSGDSYKISPQIPIIEIFEKNGIDEKENFNLTVYKVEVPLTNMNNEKILYQKMKLENQQKQIVDGFLVDNNELFLDQMVSISNEQNLSYYFDLIYDYEIKDSEFCRQIGDIPVKNPYLDKQIKCPDAELPEQQFSIYSTNVLASDLEDCD